MQTPATLKTKQKIMAMSILLGAKFLPLWQRYYWRLANYLMISVLFWAIFVFHALETPILLIVLILISLRYILREMIRGDVVMKAAKLMRARQKKA